MITRRRLLVGGLVLVLGATLLTVLTQGPEQRTVTARFSRTVGLFVGSDVRVMGMRVGKVEKISPRGTGVDVVMSYDPTVVLPDTVKAVILAPSVVSDRFVQLAPAYTGGRTLASGAVIGPDRTVAPIELDESLDATTQLAKALGPQGANASGAVNNVLQALSAVVGNGGGQQAGDTLNQLADLSRVVASDSPQLARTLDHLANLTDALQTHNGDVVSFNQSLNNVATELAADSGELSALLGTLATTLGKVSSFVTTNTSALSTNVAQLQSVTSTLVAERSALTEIIDLAPLGFQNLDETYDPQAKAVRTRANLTEITKALDKAICAAAFKQSPATATTLCANLTSMLGALGAVP